MGFGALRRALFTSTKTTSFALLHSSSQKPYQILSPLNKIHQHPWRRGLSIFATDSGGYNSLTDTRYPKRRPQLSSRRKRSSLRPSGPFAWVKHTPGDPIKPSNPNEGSVKLRNEKKRRLLRRAFKLEEAKKRKAQLQEAKRKKRDQRVERKMAAVARERAWAQRLAELQQLEEEKKRSMAA